MTDQQFKDKYQDYFNKRIEECGKICEHPYFDKTLAVLNSPYGYHYFYPLCSNFDKDGIDFHTFCSNVWPNIIHAFEDDGVISFIEAKTFFKFPENSPFTGTNLKYSLDYFVIDGQLGYNLDLKTVRKYALYHSLPDKELDSCIGTVINWKFIDFFYDLIPEMVSIYEGGNKATSRQDMFEHYERRKNFEVKFHNFIIDSHGEEGVEIFQCEKIEKH